MANLGLGNYHLIKAEGDFAIRMQGDSLELHQWCPKFQACIIPIRIGAPTDGEAERYWGFDGNFECPTVTPPIRCDNAPRCGRHKTLIKGVLV